MTVACQSELAALLEVGRTVRAVLDALRAATVPGVTTGELDEICRDILQQRGARSAPHRAYGFPGHACISINEEAVHGIPGARVILPGDVVKIDVTAEQGGLIADAAETVLVPPAAPTPMALAACARSAFERAMEVARTGRPVNVIGAAIEAEVRRCGFFVIRELTGHGVGRRIHEAPTVANFADPWATDVLQDGLVIAVEPIVTALPTRALDLADGWTIATADGGIAVHHEHTIVIRDGAPLIVTA